MSVTLYDLIPDVFPGWYLEDPGLRRRWRCCREVVRTADAVLTLSESAKADAIGLARASRRNGSPSSGAGRRPRSAGPSLDNARSSGTKRASAGLEKGFIVYNGAFNPRKGVDNLHRGLCLPALGPGQAPPAGDRLRGPSPDP